MATTDEADDSPGEYQIPDTAEYERDTSDLADVTLPAMGFTLPVYQRPPGRLMTAMEEYNLAGLFGPGDADLDDMVGDDGTISLNTFMRTDIAPYIATEKTSKDAFHWNDRELADDPTVDDFDLSALKPEDLAALVQGTLVGDDDPEDVVEQFPG